MVGFMWAVAVGGGLIALWRHDATPGPEGATALGWPAGDGMRLEASRANLVIFLHPMCPCSRASLAELAELMRRAARGPISARAVFVEPSGAEIDATTTALWQRAGEIPGVTRVRDPGGRLARAFGAETSGQTFLYDGWGQLLFSGGITGSRSHEGENAGLEEIAAALRAVPSGGGGAEGGSAALSGGGTGRGVRLGSTPVFGCGLR